MVLTEPTPGSAVGSTPTDRDLLGRPLRQSPIALAFIAWRFVRRLGMINIGAALVFALTSGFSVGLWIAAVIGAIAILVYSLLSWWRFTFVVSRDELVVTSGVISVERLVIPLDRVQSVSLDQRLLHRVVGVVSASVDTAGSAGAEFEIAAIGVDTAEALRRVVSDARVAPSTKRDGGAGAGPAMPAIPVPDQVLVRRTPGELALAGATRLPWAGLAVLVPLIALGDDVDALDGIGNRIDSFVDRWTGGGASSGVIVVVVLVIAAGAVLGALLQMVREVVTNWDLTLYRTATGLRRTAGLLNTTSRSSTLRRVQAIVTGDTPPQRWLGFTTLTLRTFGDNDIGLPGARTQDIQRLRKLVFGTSAPPPLHRRITRWFVFLAVRNIAVFALLGTIALWFRVGWWATIALTLVPLRWVVATYQWRRRRWGLDQERIAESYELLRRHTAEMPLVKAQVVTVSQTLFERRRGLATVRIQTADGFLAVPLIDRGDAEAVRDRVLYAVETDRRPVL